MSKNQLSAVSFEILCIKRAWQDLASGKLLIAFWGALGGAIISAIVLILAVYLFGWEYTVNEITFFLLFIAVSSVISPLIYLCYLWTSPSKIYNEQQKNIELLTPKYSQDILKTLTDFYNNGDKLDQNSHSDLEVLYKQFYEYVEVNIPSLRYELESDVIDTAPECYKKMYCLQFIRSIIKQYKST